MATITIYDKQTWVDSRTNITAANLNKTETALKTLSEETGTLAAEVADLAELVDNHEERLDTAEANISQLRTDCNDLQTNVVTLDREKASHEDVTTATTPTVELTASLNLLNAYFPADQSNASTRQPIAYNKHRAKLDVSIELSGGEGVGLQVGRRKKKPLWQLYYTAPSSNEAPVGTGPDWGQFYSGSELGVYLQNKHPGAVIEGVKSNEVGSALSDPIRIFNDSFYTYYMPWTSTSGLFTPYNYDTNLQLHLILYDSSANRYYLLNFGTMDAAPTFSWYIGRLYQQPHEASHYSPSRSDLNSSYGGTVVLAQRETNAWDTINLPNNVDPVGFFLSVSADANPSGGYFDFYEYFYYVGSIDVCDVLCPYVFIKTIETNSNGSWESWTDSFPIYETGTYFFDCHGSPTPDEATVVSNYLFIGNNQEGPNTNSSYSTNICPGWATYYNYRIAKAHYKLTARPKESVIYNVLDAQECYTQEYLESLAKETFKNIITSGTADPTTATPGQFYFKFSNE